MQETWLKTNRRAILAGLAFAGLVLLVGVVLIAVASSYELSRWILAGGWSIALVGALLIVITGFYLRQPRVAYSDGYLQFFLRSGAPILVPIEVVEAFFIGQGESHLGGMAADSTTINLVARIAQRFDEWQRVDVHSRLANWCDGYVSIRGTWTEPITEDLARTINHKLAEAKRDWAKQEKDQAQD